MRYVAVICGLIVFSLIAAGCSQVNPWGSKTVVIGVMPFNEQNIIGEMIALLLEKEGYSTEIQSGMNNAALYEAVKAGQVDLYVDYTSSVYYQLPNREPVDRWAPDGVFSIVEKGGSNERYPDTRGWILLAVNKQSGKICYREVDPSLLVRAPAVMYDVLRNPSIYEDNPTRDTKVVSGLNCLGAGCSYCPFKFNCYESEGGLTVYAYSDGPRFVVGTDHKAPNVPDITEAYIKEAFKK